MDPALLLPFARRAYERIVAAFPELARHARRTGSDTAARHGDLLIDVPSENKGVPTALRIDTDNDEVSFFWANGVRTRRSRQRRARIRSTPPCAC